MNPDEMKEVQQLQELLTRFNANSMYVRVENARLFEIGDGDRYIGHVAVGEDQETMFFTQAPK